MDRNAQSGNVYDGTGSDGASVTATLGQLRRKDLCTSHTKVSLRYLAACREDEVPVLIHVFAKRSNKQLPQNECPE